MRSFVRLDPDVILVGEIRDTETAVEAIRASQIGHVALSNLHANDAADALQRMNHYFETEIAHKQGDVWQIIYRRWQESLRF
jgi:type II secretory ATPase GspE/PulE/Tfp pilus assembly ATPase PilB-like protein